MNSYVQTCAGLYLKTESGQSVGKCPNTKTFGKCPNTKILPLIFLRMATVNSIVFFFFLIKIASPNPTHPHFSDHIAK